MQPNPEFLNQNDEFWATVKLLSQKLRYSKNGLVATTEMTSILRAFKILGLHSNKVFYNNQITPFGQKILDYFDYRANILNETALPALMNAEQAHEAYEKLSERLPESRCLKPENKQSNEKKKVAYLTAMVNMLIEENVGIHPCKYDASELTSFTQNKFPVRSLSRRVDGSFPGIINPIALWEIKEYYYTTSFGSRVADGVYETMLDGYELREVRKALNRTIYHYLFIDAHYTWWVKGKSYLCRIVDMMHMGLVTECIVGQEIFKRIPEIVPEWIREYEQYKEVMIDMAQ